MGDAYPGLTADKAQVKRVLRLEEERFAETLEQGMRILDEAIDGLAGTEIPGATVFKLYDTYGFPADLTADIARERGLALDMAGFEREMDASASGREPPATLAPRRRSRSASRARPTSPDTSGSSTRPPSLRCSRAAARWTGSSRRDGSRRPRPDPLLRRVGRPGG